MTHHCQKQTMSCGACRFFQTEDTDSQSGECRRHPPSLGDLLKPGTDDQDRWYGGFPKVLPSGWCGEFQPLEDRRDA